MTTRKDYTIEDLLEVAQSRLIVRARVFVGPDGRKLCEITVLAGQSKTFTDGPSRLVWITRTYPYTGVSVNPLRGIGYNELPLERNELYRYLQAWAESGPGTWWINAQSLVYVAEQPGSYTKELKPNGIGTAGNAFRRFLFALIVGLDHELVLASRVERTPPAFHELPLGGRDPDLLTMLRTRLQALLCRLDDEATETLETLAD